VTYESWFENTAKKDAFISSDKYLFGSNDGNYIYKKRDYLFKFGREWREQIQLSVYFDLIRDRRRVLVVGHSDIKLENPSLKYLRSLGIRKVYGTNTLNWNDYSESIPIGLTNNCDDSSLHRILGDTRHLVRAHETSDRATQFDAKIYVNFTHTNNVGERLEVLNIAKMKPNVSFESTEITNHGRIKYLQQCRSHSLTLCPEGNGIDTHRLWEVLYMGGTPVVKKSNFLPKVLDSLPVIFIDEWKQILDNSFLEKEWLHAQTRRSNLEALEIGFWLQRINANLNG
jgi:hypothetical protein